MPGVPIPKFGIGPPCPQISPIHHSRSLPPTDTLPPLPVHQAPSSNKHRQYQTYLSHLGSELQPCSKPKSMSPEHKRRKPFSRFNISVLFFPSDFFCDHFFIKPFPMSFIPMPSRLLLFCTPPFLYKQNPSSRALPPPPPPHLSAAGSPLSLSQPPCSFLPSSVFQSVASLLCAGEGLANPTCVALSSCLRLICSISVVIVLLSGSIMPSLNQ